MHPHDSGGMMHHLEGFDGLHLGESVGLMELFGNHDSGDGGNIGGLCTQLGLMAKSTLFVRCVRSPPPPSPHKHNARAPTTTGTRLPPISACVLNVAPRLDLAPAASRWRCPGSTLWSRGSSSG